MTVSLNIVGIFFSVDIAIDAEIEPTVKDIMDKARDQTINGPVAFNYLPFGSGNQSVVNTMMAIHNVPFHNRSGKYYRKGLYKIAQTFTMPTPNPYSVWQYYIFDDNNQRVRIDGQPSYAVTKVKDNYKIVWRLLTICNAPTQISHRMQHMVPDKLLTDEMF